MTPSTFNDKVDIVLVTFNRLPMTKRTIEFLKDNTKTPYRLIIVDNNSTDGTKDYLRGLMAEDQSLQVILLNENKGLEAAKNIALKEVKSERYVDSDNDCLVPKLAPEDWLTQLNGLMDRHPEFAAIAMRPQILVGVGPLFKNAEEVVENNVCGGSMRLMDTAAVRAVGGWRDEFSNGSEEWLIAGKLREIDKKVGYARDLFVVHLFGTDSHWGYGTGDKDPRHGDRKCNYIDAQFECDPTTLEPKIRLNE